MKVSFITTVYNEELTINDLLVSLFAQSRIPDEIIIVDGGSTDNTISEISNFKFPPLRKGSAGQAISNSRAQIKLIFKKGNRSVGRNEAIKRSSNEIIACCDAGNTLERNWVKNIVKSFENPKVDVVAGYYRGNANNVFEKCLIPYVLVMPDKIDRNNFLPATRSLAFKKSIWEKVGRFPEKFSNNEDYVFARNLKKINAKIVFEKKAIVYWKPRRNIKDAFVMFYRFAKGDSETRIFRPKVILIFVRYITFLIFLSLFFLLKSYLILNTLYLILLVYILWAIIKNYKYIKDARAILYLPLMQFTSDIAVISGTINGLLTQRLKILVEGFFYISIIYLIILLSFRQLRSLFSPPKIAEDGIVGYAQYFGYPLYFETIIFFIFILSPIVVFFILSGARNYKD